MKTKELILGIAFNILFGLSLFIPNPCDDFCVITPECSWIYLGIGLLNFVLFIITMTFYWLVIEDGIKDVFKNGFWSKGKI